MLRKRRHPRARREPAASARWSAGCSYGAEAYTLAADLPRGRPDGAAPASSAPTSTAAWSPAPARRSSPPRTLAPRPRRARALVRARRRRLPGHARAAQRSCASRSATCCACRSARGRYDLVLCRNTVIYFNEDVRDALHAPPRRVAAPRRLPHGRLHRARRRRRRPRPRARPPLHLPEDSDGHLRVPADVPRGGAGAPPGAEPRRRQDRGAARRPRDRRRDLPHRALDEGHERDDGLRRHGGAHARDGGRLRAAAPARAAASGATRSTSCSPCLDALEAAVDSIDADGRGEHRPGGAGRAPARAGPRPHARAGRRARRRPPTPEQPAERAGRRPPRRARQRRARRRRRDAGRPRLHGAGRARPSTASSSLATRPRTPSRASPARVIEVWLATDARGRRVVAAAARACRTSPSRHRAGRRPTEAPGRRPARRRAGDRRRRDAAAAPPRRRAPRRGTPRRAPRPSASTPSASTSSCTSWASSSSTARASRRWPPRPTSPASRRRCRT